MGPLIYITIIISPVILFRVLTYLILTVWLFMGYSVPRNISPRSIIPTERGRYIDQVLIFRGQNNETVNIRFINWLQFSTIS